jgi:arginase
MTELRSGARASRLVHVVGAPLDLGQTVRGTDVGPAALRYAGLLPQIRELGMAAKDLGNLDAPSPADVGERDVFDVIADVCGHLRDRVAESQRDGAIVVTLGGDHSVAIGSVSGSMARGPVGLVWIDAHGDFNTPDTSLSGNVHGMPLAVLFGHGDSRLTAVCEGQRLDPRNVALVGVRDLDPREKEALAAEGVAVYTMRDVDERGMGTIAREALSRVQGPGRVHVSLDIDALDPSEAPGTTTAVRGGLTYREAHLLLETIADAGLLCAIDVVEVNPMRDVRNQTALTAVGLVVSALGKSIL